MNLKSQNFIQTTHKNTHTQNLITKKLKFVAHLLNRSKDIKKRKLEEKPS